MTNITLSIPNELHRRMKTHSEIRWSEVVRKSLAEKVHLLDELERVVGKSRLTKKDVDELSRKIKREAFEDVDKK
jgi:hypothetical protein